MKDMPRRKACRKFYKDLREDMSQEQVAIKSQAICRQVLSSAQYKDAKTIFGYYPLGNEVNCLSVLTQALIDGKRVVLPRCASDCQMDFYEIHSLNDVEEGNFRVMEPKMVCRRFLTDNAEGALVLVPGVVFDMQGNRYGYGKGYYDRYFARFPQLKRMALAYAEQLSKEPLACLETDLKMHIIMTESERISVDDCDM